MGRKGETTSYVPMGFEEFYQRKLSNFCARLRSIIFDTVYIVGQERQCSCGCRVMVRQCGFEQDRCVRCVPIRSRDPEAMAQLVKEYPDVGVCEEEWNPPQKEKTQRFFTTETVAFGAHVEEARLAKAWSQNELASKILKKDMTNISRSTINMVEKGHQKCSSHVRGQLDHIFLCDLCKAGARCEQLRNIQGLREITCLEA